MLVIYLLYANNILVIYLLKYFSTEPAAATVSVN